MTVAELIEELKRYPSDIPVYIYADGEEEAIKVFKTDAYGIGTIDCVEITSR